MNQVYFHVNGMTVGYDGVPLIQNMEFSLKQGEILTLIGPNGAGKTTILRSIIRQLPLLGGRCCILDRDMAEIPPKELAQGMAVVLTDKINPELMTCRDVVATGRYPYTGRFGVLSQEDWTIVQETMALVGIEALAGQSFSATSDGQRQRVMLARALCQEPDLLILDEPTSYLDIRHKLEFLSCLQRLSRQRGLTVILSLHELDLATRISDKIACIRGDFMDRFGTPEEICSGDYLTTLYGISVGRFDPASGDVELPAPAGKPSVFVLAGGGTGAAVFRRLQREGRPFITGILWENDLDFPAAKALSAEVISVPAFVPIGAEAIARAKAAMDTCDQVLCTLALRIAGPLAAPLQEMMEYAAAQGKEVRYGI